MMQCVLGELLRRPLRPVYFMAEAATWKGYQALARGFARLWPTNLVPRDRMGEGVGARVARQWASARMFLARV
jgi:hypothetical protein